MLNKILEIFPDEKLITADGFNDAILGIDDNEMRLIYSVSKCIEILQKDMDQNDAIEYFDFNIKGAYIGQKTPIWCMDFF